MRTKLFICLISAIFFAGCGEEDPCLNTDCENGGICDDGECFCDLGWQGQNCTIEKVPASVSITGMTVNTYPVVDASGAGWDLASGPDLIFRISNASGVVYEHPTFRLDVVGEQRFDFFFEMEKVTLDHRITLWDYDDLSAWDLMGSVVFEPYAAGRAFPESLGWQNSTGSVQITLELSYFFD